MICVNRYCSRTVDQQSVEVNSDILPRSHLFLMPKVQIQIVADLIMMTQQFLIN